LEAPEDILGWSDDQIESELASSLSGRAVVCEWTGSSWSVRIEKAGFDGGASRIVYRSDNLDRRLALLEAYGYVWLNEQPSISRGSLWDPERPRPARAPVPRPAEVIADPPDLDPEEIAAVYRIRHRETNGD
jgi:hypothetical protein